MLDPFSFAVSVSGHRRGKKAVFDFREDLTEVSRRIYGLEINSSLS